jgi:hypothetical protein
MSTNPCTARQPRQYSDPGRSRRVPRPGHRALVQASRVSRTVRDRVSPASRMAAVGFRTFQVSAASTCERAHLDSHIAARIRLNPVHARALMG